MRPADVVDFHGFGHHRAVVLEVADDGCVIIQCTSHERDHEVVAVRPQTTEYLSLGWSRHDERTSYFYASGIHVVPPDQLTPVTVGATARRCHPVLFTKLRAQAGAWAVQRRIALDAARLLMASASAPGG